MITRNRKTSFLFGGNAPYVEEQYETYLADPTTVSEDWRGYFDALQDVPAVDGSDTGDVAHGPVVSRFIELAKQTRTAGRSENDVLSFARKQVAVQALISAYRMVGTRNAHLDPLRWTAPVPVPELNSSYYDLSHADMNTKFSMSGAHFSDQVETLGDLMQALKETYCGTLGAEFMYLADPEQRNWWSMRLESSRSKAALDNGDKLHILERLTAAEGLEKYLHARYVGQKRFSLEGGESLIVLLDELVAYGATKGVKSSILGMAHRGRLNVLVNIVGKPPAALFDEFEGKTAHLLPAGDVKYHKGFTGWLPTATGPAEVTLAFNPSHLEVVNPVVQGIARARAEVLGQGASAVLPVEIHGDAAVSGQGIVMETMNLSNTRGYGTGGTIHVVVNNQVGFTTSDPRDVRSSFYCTDIAKMIEAPVLHVNGDDPEAVIAATRLAIDFRATFNKSVVIELVCFRRHGHQEQDTPNITQPMMYRSIAGHPGVRTLYARKLVDQQLLTAEDVEKYVHDYRERLDTAQSVEEKKPAAQENEEENWPQLLDGNVSRIYYAPPLLDLVQKLALKITSIPDQYSLHPLVGRVVSARRDMAEGKRPLDWGMAEHMAFASLLSAGIDVRLSGQDSERGTFSHRHAVLHDQNRASRAEGTYVPLEHVSDDQGRFSVTNSVLSEGAVLGFEYGYSVVRQNSLVLWEAQFGDFANGAQVVIDNFLSAGAAKWGQRSGVTMLLPHGQEGEGPEHASARLERYLQLCAQDNMRVCQPTTPAQIFHLLRMQAVLHDRVPLIVMTPKSLLRHPEAVSSLDDLAKGRFNEILAESPTKEAASKVDRVILCSGKVYYELLERRRKSGKDNIALIRVEQLYPFPAKQISSELERYPNLKSVVWCQEESKNQGSWNFVMEQLLEIVKAPATLRYIGPEATASTAPGYKSMHLARQEKFLHAAIDE
ncbi:2-oxoglutarate dehydrogenase E1 component [Paraburkholderia hospita]|uniref:oxoglutarate dehydrogenase (succinyl-transferring) n=1 Tax=Paraburkholderia hospita TaxID=169430 RepID=A0AAN1JHR8_9BURK|nr:2-oxoglutarate dehydrogenase E1 component [Paraburkholderia hospita]AUT73399.1 2-oxoglutarate dehydrogenase E1 component [Paraburkholderia hospita]EIM98877.1 2-oxoglutarate dehydrogenase E1 component [Paraburkholderia hospita]OUL71960.1 2-oxoglutarate dehydrogenase subunit E1 [Paraburkholderia hospita]OUL76683.1 2-oxoglutarate dehydrogenase subunit E1 [Paraburkholderia hospita]SEH77552.1 2-oxoglutarate dehydrogenase E1 component [Paraburkholderia hospita]